MWVAYALLSAFFASLTAIFAKIGIENVNTDLATAIRTIVILVLTWSIVFARGHGSSITTLSKGNLLFLVLSGLSTGLSWLFYFKALQMGDVSKVAPLDKLSVVITMILAFVFFKEPLTGKELVGGGLIVAGAFVLVL